MKVLNINLQNSVYSKPSVKQNSSPNNSFDYNKMFHPQEILGRSQINFTSNNFEFCEDDEKFIDSTSKNMRLSAENKEKLKDTISSFLMENNYKTLDNLEYEGSEEDQGVFVERVGKALDLSDYDTNIFFSDLTERLTYKYYMDKYTPVDRKYMKDFEVFDTIFDKYNIEEPVKYDIYEVLTDEAESHECEMAFDLFKQEDPMNLYTMQYIKEELGEDIALNLLIDIGNIAAKNETERHSIVNKTKWTDGFYEDQCNISIVENICENYNIPEDCFDDMMSVLKSRDDKNVKQVAFEIADKYNLPSGAEEFIEENIVILEQLQKMLKDRK